jgi:hypothetical protein
MTVNGSSLFMNFPMIITLVMEEDHLHKSQPWERKHFLPATVRMTHGFPTNAHNSLNQTQTIEWQLESHCKEWSSSRATMAIRSTRTLQKRWTQALAMAITQKCCYREDCCNRTPQDKVPCLPISLSHSLDVFPQNQLRYPFHNRSHGG